MIDMNDQVAFGQVGERIYRLGGLDSTDTSLRLMLSEQFVMAEDEEFLAGYGEAVVDVTDGQMKTFREGRDVKVGLNHFQESLFLGRFFAKQIYVLIAGDLEEFFQDFGPAVFKLLNGLSAEVYGGRVDAG